MVAPNDDSDTDESNGSADDSSSDEDNECASNVETNDNNEAATNQTTINVPTTGWTRDEAFIGVDANQLFSDSSKFFYKKQ